MDANAALTALAIIRDIHGLPSMASASDIVARARETKAAADLAGSALLIERGRDLPAATAEEDDDLPIGPRRTFKPRSPMDLGRVAG